MALDKFTDGDARLGKGVASGTGTAFISAAMLVDSTGTELPWSGTAVGASSGNVANAQAQAALAAVSGKTNYVSGIDISFSGATAASVKTATLAGLLGGTQSFTITVPAGATIAGQPFTLMFDPPFPASGTNTAITLTLPALGAGNTNATVNIRGFQK